MRGVGREHGFADDARRADARAAGHGVATLAEPLGVRVIETVISPFHCFYQDALAFHQEAKLRHAHSTAESSRYARAALAHYLLAAEALVHQAAAELAAPGTSEILCDPMRPLPLHKVWGLLPAITCAGTAGILQPEVPPWPQFRELLELRTNWSYPGDASRRRVYYRQSAGADGAFDPLQPHQVTSDLGIAADQLVYPLTGLPRDPYALRHWHIDTVRSILDAAIATLDRRMGGALTRDGRHRREPVRVLVPAD